MTLDRNRCSKCHAATNDKLIEVFPAWNSPILLGGQTPCSTGVCSSCLVGVMVPAIRPSTETWEFGTVEHAFWDGDNLHGRGLPHKNSSSDSTRNGRYFLRFMDSQCEWATVETTAYDQYIHHFKNDSSERFSSSVEYFGDVAVGSFGNDDDDDDEPTDMVMDDDASDDFHRPSTPRRLEKLFEVDGQILDSPMILPPPVMKGATTPHRGGLFGRSPRQHQYQYGNKASPSGTTISAASSLSTTTTTLDDGIMVGEGGDCRTPGNSPFTTPTKASFSRRNGAESSTTTSPKYSQKLWSPEEDAILLRAITAESKAVLKWSNVAKAVPGRSGKQCRERYLNHLTPNIKLKNWSPVEDATIFRLYHTDGSKWSMMSKLLRGRSDNGIKNRYHHLKRRLQRQMQLIPISTEIESIVARVKASSPWMTMMGYCSDDDEPWLLKYVATQSMLPRQKLDNTSEAAGYLRPACDELCARCGLVAPSRQTGSLVCKTTGWCEVCIRVSPCISGDLLRALDDMRKVLTSEDSATISKK